MKPLILLQLIVLPNLLHGASVPYGNQYHFIESPKLSKWGEWGNVQKCPSDQVVVGMQLKVHEYQGVKDDTGLNGVKFYCQNPYSTNEYSDERVGITSLVGNFGEWKKDFICPPSTPSQTGVDTKLIAVGFQLRSETSAGVKDDTAGNNMRLVCSDLHQKVGYTYLEGDGTQRGEWTDKQLCWPGYAICGLQTQVETSRSIDTTGLNNLKVICCRTDSKVNAEESGRIENDNSSGSSSLESSSSGEKDNQNQEDVHEQRGDHATSQESNERTGSGRLEESHEIHNEDEQELIAHVDPEPTEENLETSVAANEDVNLNATVTLNQVAAVPSQEPSPSSSLEHGPEDDTLPEEIAKIDQVDNSEANQEEEEENISTATDSQRVIPEEVINALADADADNTGTSSNANEDIYSVEHNKQFHWGTEEGNMTDVNEIPGIDNNSLDEEPKSSPRFGKIGTNDTVDSATIVNNACGKVTHQFAFISIFVLYYFCSLIN